MTLLLDARTIGQLLTWDDLIPLMRRTLAEFSSGHAVQPVRTQLEPSPGAARLYLMPGALPASGAFAVKPVTVAAANAARGLPTHYATVILLDPATGATLALLDGGTITEWRTAAVSAAAAHALSRRESATLAVIGAGVQARSHIRALCSVRSITRVRIWSPTRERREALTREFAADGAGGAASSAAGGSAGAGRDGPEFATVDDAETAVRGADLIVTASGSATPVVRGAWLERGACVIAVGASTPSARELDADVVTRARVFVDSRAAALAESGDILLARAERPEAGEIVAGEIGEVFAGACVGRESADQITVFKSLGLAVEDAAAARWLFDRARERGVGREVEL